MAYPSGQEMVENLRKRKILERVIELCIMRKIRNILCLDTSELPLVKSILTGYSAAEGVSFPRILVAEYEESTAVQIQNSVQSDSFRDFTQQIHRARVKVEVVFDNVRDITAQPFPPWGSSWLEWAVIEDGWGSPHIPSWPGSVPPALHALTFQARGIYGKHQHARVDLHTQRLERFVGRNFDNFRLTHALAHRSSGKGATMVVYVFERDPGHEFVYKIPHEIHGWSEDRSRVLIKWRGFTTRPVWVDADSEEILDLF